MIPMPRLLSSAALISRLLRRNLSPAQICAFVACNFVGLAIVIAGVQMYADLRPVWDGDDNFIGRDYIVVNPKVSASPLGQSEASEGFSSGSLSELNAQPWVRRVGAFESADYHIDAAVDAGARSMRTALFFESVPTDFLGSEVPSGWRFDPAVGEVPVIMAKDYLTLYNFGFASSAGLPQLSERVMGSIPLTLQLRSNDGTRGMTLRARVVGFTNRLNTILVPEDFMRWSNAALGSGTPMRPKRVIIEVSRPGDSAIDKYLDSHDLEQTGDAGRSRAAMMLRLGAGIVVGVGAVITFMSLLILLLSVSLLMQKNRPTLHSLLMQGCAPAAVRRPYARLVVCTSVLSLALAVGAMFALRAIYLPAVRGIGGGASVWLSLLVGLLLTALSIGVNVAGISRRVRSAWRL